MAMKAGGDGELNAEINVTPMVDVMLVLLIIFMITAPMMNHRRASSICRRSRRRTSRIPSGKLVLSIKADHTIYLGGTQVTWADLEAKLKAQRARQEGERALHRGR